MNKQNEVQMPPEEEQKEPGTFSCTLKDCLANHVRVQMLESLLQEIKRNVKENPDAPSKIVLELLNKPELNLSSIQERRDSMISQNASTAEFSSRMEADFNILAEIGSGAYGSVLQVEHKLDGKTYAIKKIPLEKVNAEREKQKKEVEILCALNHPHIVRYYGSWLQSSKESDQSSSYSEPSNSNGSSHGWEIIFESSDKCRETTESATERGASITSGADSHLSARSETASKSGSNYSDCLSPLTMYIQMELCDSSLREAIDQGLPKNPRQVWAYLQQIITGLEYIHEKGVIHRDLKPANILIAGRHTIKIGDFGLSTKTLLIDSPFKDETAAGNEQGMTSSVGTSFYIAPEVRSTIAKNVKIVYDKSSDIYSLGVIMVEMLHAFETGMERIHTLTGVCSNQVKLPNELENRLLGFYTQILKSCLDHMPSSRPVLSNLWAAVVTQDCALLLFHPDEVLLNSDSLSSSTSRRIKYLRVYEKPKNSIFAKHRLWNEDITLPPILEYRPASLDRLSDKPQIFFHFPIPYSSVLDVSDTFAVMKKGARFVQQFLDKEEDRESSNILESNLLDLQQIYQALAKTNHDQELNIPLEDFLDFVRTCKSRASFVCTVMIESPNAKVPSPWNEKLRVPFDLTKLENKLQDPDLKKALGPSLKDAGFLDSSNYFTESWFKTCANGAVWFNTKLPNLPLLQEAVQQPSGTKVMELLRKAYFEPYFLKFKNLSLKEQVVAENEIGLSYKICAMNSLL